MKMNRSFVHIFPSLPEKYLIMAYLRKHVFFKNFPDRNSKNDDVIKYLHHLEFFFMKQKIYV